MSEREEIVEVLLVCDKNTLLHPLVEFVKYFSSIKGYELHLLRLASGSDRSDRTFACRFYELFNYIDRLRIWQLEEGARSTIGSRIASIPPQTNFSHTHTDPNGRIVIDFTESAESVLSFINSALCYRVRWDSRPKGFWEVVNRRALSEVSLLEWYQQDWRCRFTTQVRTHSVSPVVNQARMERAAFGLTMLLLRSIQARQSSIRPDKSAPAASSKPQILSGEESKVTNLVVLRLGLRAMFAAVAARVGRRQRRVQWSVGVLPERIVPTESTQALTVVWMNSEPGTFIADPFPFSFQDQKVLFVERFCYRRQRGHIAACFYLNGKPDGHFRSVLEEPFHLSYPFVIEHGGRAFMLPERAASGQVVLYESTSFPGEWRSCAVLLADFPGVDPTLFYHHGMWWLFCSMGGLAMQDSNLNLFYSPELFGPYQAHPLNPIVLDISCARMAGRIIERDGTLYRPAQDCTTRYGGHVVFMKIEELTKTSYREVAAGKIEANRGSRFGQALHTVQIDGDFTLITGMRYS